MGKYSKIMKKLTKDVFRDITSLGGLPLLGILFLFLIAYDVRQAVFFGIGIALIVIIGVLIKIMSPKKRPDGQTHTNIIEKIDAGSFPSLHAARTLFTGLFFALLVGDLYLSVLITLLVLLIGASRVYRKRHYWIDIAGGYVLGIVVWFIMTQIRTLSIMGLGLF